jgi:hypothetical protein
MRMVQPVWFTVLYKAEDGFDHEGYYHTGQSLARSK